MFMLLLALLSETAGAEDIRLRVPKLRFSNEHQTFPRGGSLYVKIRDFDSSKYPDLHARLFWGTKQTLPERYYDVVSGPGGDRCYIYDSTPLPTHSNLLGVNLGAVPRTGLHWVVVFEDGNWKNEAVKISQAAIAEYFARGFEFSVAPPPKPRSSILSVVLAPFSRFNHEKPAQPAEPPTTLRPAVLAAASVTVDCIHFRNVDEEVLVAEMGRCSGCAKPVGQETAGVLDWLSRLGFGLMR